MRSFVKISDFYVWTNTGFEIINARRLLDAEGMESVPVYRGDPEGEHYPTGETLNSAGFEVPPPCVPLDPPPPEKACAWRLDVTAVLGQSTVEPWLREIVDAHMRADSAFESAIALGLIGRLWRPTNGTEKWLALAGEETPASRARRAAQAIGDRDRAMIAEEGVRATGALVEALCNGTETDEDTVRVLHLRDDLACVEWVLSRRDPLAALHLQSRLSDLDRDQEPRMDTLAVGFETENDIRIREVARVDVNEWWTFLVEL